ncbi:MAG: adenine deaminase [Lachnospiraceae bacterium]|nr:adenine deaminase [Lachnospiraceae bacterium]
MRVRQNRDRTRLIRAAMQEIPCDLTVENAQFVNVITGEVYPASVDVIDGIVVRVREEGETTVCPSKEIYDAKGKYLVPGFIDVHMHIESTMMIPENFGRAAILCGTTSVFVDPHEIGNVLGIDGIKFMIENAKKSPVRQFNLASSCVPSVPGVEQAGASFGAKEIAELLDMEGVYGVAEVMDFYNVIHDEKRMHEVVEEGVKRGALIQGHAPGLHGKEIAAYHLAGMVDNHCMNCAEDMVANLRAGMYTDMQESSLSPRRMPQLLDGIKKMRYTDHVTLCNDDVHAKDLLETGHVNRLTKSAMMEGIDPIDVIRWVTYNASRAVQMDDIGALAPGYLADMQLLDALDGRNPYAVFREGKLLVEDFKFLNETPAEVQTYENTMHLDYVESAEDFVLSAPEGAKKTVTALVLDYGNSQGFGHMCDAAYEEVPVVDGKVDLSGRDDLFYVCCFNRHGKSDHTIAICKGFGLEKGAIASTVAHDCHNFLCMYKNPEDAFVLAKALRECGGGVASALDGEVIGLLELPLAGLMSPLPCEELVPAIAAVEEAAKTICPKKMLMQIAVIALACIPGAIITDLGVIDGSTQEWYPLWK